MTAPKPSAGPVSGIRDTGAYNFGVDLGRLHRALTDAFADLARGMQVGSAELHSRRNVLAVDPREQLREAAYRRHIDLERRRALASVDRMVADLHRDVEWLR